MTDDAIAVYPHPTATNCAPCPFREPCIAESAGDDPEPILEQFRTRRPDAQVGRLGGVSWSTNRGAAPPRFRDDGGDR